MKRSKSGACQLPPARSRQSPFAKLMVETVEVKYATLPEAPASRVVEAVEYAKGVLNRYGWCQGNLAIDSLGKAVGVKSPSACAFCTFGALWRTEYERPDLKEAVIVAERVLYHLVSAVANWNDTPGRTKEDVLVLLDRTIKYVKAEASNA